MLISPIRAIGIALPQRLRHYRRGREVLYAGL